jgi:hypothetical protein
MQSAEKSRVLVLRYPVRILVRVLQGLFTGKEITDYFSGVDHVSVTVDLLALRWKNITPLCKAQRAWIHARVARDCKHLLSSEDF